MKELIKFVDDNFRRPTFTDILSSLEPLAAIIALIIVAGSVASSALASTPISQWTPLLVSIVAMLIAFSSFTMASRKYANRRLAYREAKRLEPKLANRSILASCLLPPLVALKIENQPMRLQDLFEVDASLFGVSKLMEKYYSS